ncbi:alpha-E domain-containing protein, partial [Acidisphaera rubrifaciens]|uniref:alpha-E domain-containing protein n=1 Tax=Acidisphaera rubrifaciens TaxID=50715 RepID=UPI0006628351
AVRGSGTIGDMFAELAQLTERVRDRLTAEMYAAFTQALRAARADTQEVRQSLDALSHAMTAIIRYSALVAGVAAESMVRGGGWMFLDTGRRVERAMAVARAVGECLSLPPARIETGLRLILELCDSAITYRSRYMTVVQAAPVLDLVLADEGNPRGLAFQLSAMRRLLDDLAGPDDPGLGAVAGELLAEARAAAQRVIASPDQAMEAALLPQTLLGIAEGVAALSERLSRQYFALLPPAQSLGPQPVEPELRGAA